MYAQEENFYMEKINTDFQEVSFRCIPQFILVRNDNKLVSFLDQKGIGSMELARMMKDAYKKEMGKEIAISDKSLAIEILGHVYCDKFSSMLKMLPVPKDMKMELSKIASNIKSHTDIIDCGEKSVDSNRWIWDKLEPWASMIFTLCGKHA